MTIPSISMYSRNLFDQVHLKLDCVAIPAFAVSAKSRLAKI
jgi:hypothetical protein